jgi:hypothetical protein
MRKLSLLLLLASYASTAQVKQRDPFIGLEKKEIVAEYGVPTEIQKDARSGTEVLI